MSYQLHQGIPAPVIKRGATTSYPFAGQQVGQSFFVPLEGQEPAKVVERLRIAVSRWKKASGADKSIKFVVAESQNPDDLSPAIGVFRTA